MQESSVPDAPVAPPVPVPAAATTVGFGAALTSAAPLTNVHINTLTAKRKTPAPPSAACSTDVPVVTAEEPEATGESQLKRIREE